MRKTLVVSLAVLIFMIGCGPRRPSTEPAPSPDKPAAVEATFEPPKPEVEVAAAKALMMADPPSSAMTAHYINVGQAAATLLEFPCGALLIDAGAQDASRTKDLLAYLNDFFERRTDLDRTLESIIITHNHVDHTLALREVIEAFRVKRLIENGQRGGLREAIRDLEWAQSNAANLKLMRLDVDDAQIAGLSRPVGLHNAIIDPINCSGTNPDIRILSADLDENPEWPNDDFRNKNNHSLVIRVTFAGSSFLFTGDLEEPAIETMVEHYQKTRLLDVDVWQVGHHGSQNGTTESLLEAMTPQIAVIQMGPATDKPGFTAFGHGHPRIGIIELLEASLTRQRSRSKTVAVATGQRRFRNRVMRAAIYGTGWEGTVRVRGTAAGTFVVTSIE